MKQTFAKVIELDNYQVLVTKKSDPVTIEDAEFIIRVESVFSFPRGENKKGEETSFKRVGINIGFDSERHMNQSFESFNEVKAESMILSIEAQLDEQSKPKSKIIMPDNSLVK